MRFEYVAIVKEGYVGEGEELARGFSENHCKKELDFYCETNPYYIKRCEIVKIKRR